MKKLLCILSLTGCLLVFAMDDSSDEDYPGYLGMDKYILGPGNNPLLKPILEERCKEKERVQEKDWFEELKENCNGKAKLELEPDGEKLYVTFEGSFNLNDPQVREKNTQYKNTVIGLIQRFKQLRPGICIVKQITFETELIDPNYFEITHSSLD